MEAAKPNDRLTNRFPARLTFRRALILLALAVGCLVLLRVVSAFVGLASAFAPPTPEWPKRLTALVAAQFFVAAFGVCVVVMAFIERMARRPFLGSSGLLICMVTAVVLIGAFAGCFRHRLYLNMRARGNAACYQGVRPGLSPDGKTVVFGAPCPGGIGGDIVLLDLSSGATTYLTRSCELSRRRRDPLDYLGSLIGSPLQPAGPYNGDPSFSPDGSKILFVSNRDDNLEIYVMNRDGSNQKRLTYTDEDESCPSFSPDGRAVVFSSTRSKPVRYDLGSDCVWVMNANGTSPRPLTLALAEADTPSWSPDGREIVFYGQPNYMTQATTWMMHADGTEPRSLKVEGQFPSFSPDSNSLVMVIEHYGGSNPGCEIVLANPDGSGLREITNSLSYKMTPRFTADGQSIIFALDPIRKVYSDDYEMGGRNWEIWMIDRDGSNLRRIAPAYLEESRSQSSPP
jgi:TolB protein